MSETWFEIQLAMPVALTAQLQRDITIGMRPRWRVTGVEMEKLEDGLFRLRLFIHQDDILPDSPITELQEFRDLVVGLVAFAAICPVNLRSKGIFDFPTANAQRKQTSLGPMNYEFPAKPLTDLKPVILGLGLEPKYTSVLHFLWVAINSELPLYRFINLAIATELLVRHDSPVRGSRYPQCGNPTCGLQLERCPRCGREWLIPVPLRDRVAFLLDDPDVRSEFIAWRNRVFHGLSDDLQSSSAGDIGALNDKLLIVVRNYLGHKLGLPPIASADLGVALDRPDIAITVFYAEQRGASAEPTPSV